MGLLSKTRKAILLRTLKTSHLAIKGAGKHNHAIFSSGFNRRASLIAWPNKLTEDSSWTVTQYNAYTFLHLTYFLGYIFFLFREILTLAGEIFYSPPCSSTKSFQCAQAQALLLVSTNLQILTPTTLFTLTLS